MSNRTTLILTVTLILIATLASVLLAPQMPEEMASHWNAQGEVDGYQSKFWGLYLMPLVSLGMLGLYLLIPQIDPLKENIARFRGYFNTFIVLMLVFLLYVHGLSLAWNLGYTGFDMGRAMTPAIGLLFIYIGVLLKNARRNWFIGIRTPWTLSSERVWDATHRRGSVLYIGAGVVTLLGLLFERWAIWFVIVPVIVASLYLVVYSYFLWRSEQASGQA
ncbi:MAG: SdpI family protein [Anaerolineae bacterium]|nr:MAG: SdpI family protein [Anaerolineae bacterium]